MLMRVETCVAERCRIIQVNFVNVVFFPGQSSVTPKSSHHDKAYYEGELTALRSVLRVRVRLAALGSSAQLLSDPHATFIMNL